MSYTYEEILMNRLNTGVLEQWNAANEQRLLEEQVEAEMLAEKNRQAREKWLKQVEAEKAAKSKEIADTENARIDAAIASDLERARRDWYIANPAIPAREVYFDTMILPLVKANLIEELAQKEHEARKAKWIEANQHQFSI